MATESLRYRVVFKVDDLGSTKVVLERGPDRITAVARAAMSLREYHPGYVTVLTTEEIA